MIHKRVPSSPLKAVLKGPDLVAELKARHGKISVHERWLLVEAGVGVNPPQLVIEDIPEQTILTLRDKMAAEAKRLNEDPAFTEKATVTPRPVQGTGSDKYIGRVIAEYMSPALPPFIDDMRKVISEYDPTNPKKGPYLTLRAKTPKQGGPERITLNWELATKGDALRHFSKITGVPIKQILKTGDSGAKSGVEMGNDVPLLVPPLAVQLGKDKPMMDGVDHLYKEGVTGPEQVEELLQRDTYNGVRYKAFITDIDDTILAKGKELTERMVYSLIDKMKKGIHVALATRVCLSDAYKKCPQLFELVKQQGLQHMFHVYTLNGAAHFTLKT